MHSLRLVPLSEHSIREVLLDFILSRKAALLAPGTVRLYESTLGSFIEWLHENGQTRVTEMSSRQVRRFLSSVANRGVSDATVNKYARAIKTFLRFCYREGYISQQIRFDMPRVSEKLLPVLSSEELRLAISSCRTKRDRAILMLLVDTGARASEALALNWGDIEIGSGLVRIRRGKGRKARSVVVGVKTRRAVLTYRRTVSHSTDDPVIQTYQGTRLKYAGLRMALERIGTRAGVRLHAHLLRRTFATMSLRAGINPLHLQALMGHSSLEMTRQYIRMVDEDLLAAHRQHGPVDRFLD